MAEASSALESSDIWGEQEDEVDEEIMAMSTDDIKQRTQYIENETRMLRQEIQRLGHEQASSKEKIKVRARRPPRAPDPTLPFPSHAPHPQENKEKIKLNKQLPYLVGNVVEVLDVAGEDDGCVCVCLLR